VPFNELRHWRLEVKTCGDVEGVDELVVFDLRALVPDDRFHGGNHERLPLRSLAEAATLIALPLTPEVH
jgi:hypothetical protein